MGSTIPDTEDDAFVISAAAHYDIAGTVLVAAIFLLACSNVCAGLIFSIDSYLERSWPKIPYDVWAILITIISCIIANVGLTAILTYSIPILMALCPLGIRGMVMGLVPSDDTHHRVENNLRLRRHRLSHGRTARRLFPDVFLPFDLLPLAPRGMGWVVPALVAIPIGFIIEHTQDRSSTLSASSLAHRAT